MFLVNLWLSPAIVGFYALALGLAARTEMVNHSPYTVLIPMASALKGRQAVGAYLKQGFKRSALISLLLLPALPLARWFIPFFYGSEYLPSVFLFQLLLGVVIFDIFTLPALLLIYTFDRPDLSALAEGLRVVSLVLLAAWLIPTLGPVGAIVAKFCAKLVGVGVTLVLLTLESAKKREDTRSKN
jgi:O-antigen/teichoic acid export membrane protein